jgi:hypothetical protein
MGFIAKGNEISLPKRQVHSVFIAALFTVIKKWETHLAGKTTEKRQNFDPSTPPASTKCLQFTLNRESRRATGPPAAHVQTAWEDADKVSLAVLWYSHRQPWGRAA